MSFTDIIRDILYNVGRPLSPQDISDIVKSDYNEYYLSDTNIRNVERGNYHNLDHALLSQVYNRVITSRLFDCDRAQRPMLVSLREWMNQAAPNNTEARNRRTIRRTNGVEFAHPTPAVVEECVRNWHQMHNYRLQESSLTLLFNDLCPYNKIIEHILLKVSTLNDFYATNIYDTFTVAKHIYNNDIDMQLDNSDYELVNKLATITINGNQKNFYSFATKYCSHHRPSTYPIYDSFVGKMLLAYSNRDQFDSFARDDLKNYPKFIEIFKKFQQYYGLESFSLRDIDIFLWLKGKQYFPRVYRNNGHIEQVR